MNDTLALLSSRYLGRPVFVITLAWNLALCYLLRARRWYDRIDDTLILGALPFASHVAGLYALGVRGVVNTCAEYRGPLAEYARLGMAELHVPTQDFTPPSRAHLDAALAFVELHAKRGESVYVHCKAGRGRSATVALCWLMARTGLSAEEAQARLLGIRPHVRRDLPQYPVVREFEQECRRAKADAPPNAERQTR